MNDVNIIELVEQLSQSLHLSDARLYLPATATVTMMEA